MAVCLRQAIGTESCTGLHTPKIETNTWRRGGCWRRSRLAPPQPRTPALPRQALLRRPPAVLLPAARGAPASPPRWRAARAHIPASAAGTLSAPRPAIHRSVHHASAPIGISQADHSLPDVERAFRKYSIVSIFKPRNSHCVMHSLHSACTAFTNRCAHISAVIRGIPKVSFKQR